MVKVAESIEQQNKRELKALAETLSKTLNTAQLVTTSNQTNMISPAPIQASYPMAPMPGYGAMYGGMPSVNYNMNLIQGNSWLPGHPGFFPPGYGYQPFVSMPGLVPGNVMSSVNPNLHQVPASNINLFENNQVPPSINNPYLNLQQVQNNIMATK